MYNFLTIFLFLLSLCSFGQNHNEDVSIKLKESFHSLSYDDLEFKVNYIKNEKTLYFESKRSGNSIKGYKMLIEDIHPKGIFLYESKETFSIRILSLNNGNVFIEDNLDSKYKYSKTTNHIDIGNWSEDYKPHLKLFISIFKDFLASKKPIKNNNLDNEEIIITEEKNKN